MQTFDYILFALYPAVLLGLGLIKRLSPESSVSELVLAGRRLTLPAFIASLVSTWYGGILAVGEFTFTNGISNWLVFGLPYYIAAALFAIYLSKKARESKLVSIPQQLSAVYDERTALLGSVIVFLTTVPAAYVLMLGVLFEQLLGWPFWVGAMAGVLFSVVYLFQGGFGSVVRTDIFQFTLMFAGFGVLLFVLVSRYGFGDFLTTNLPAGHLTWNGGNSRWYIMSWYVIALSTLVEPNFFQRCYAARTPAIARNGILGSIFFWIIFDFMTTSCGLYARALLPELTDPVASFPALATLVLPTGLLGLFGLGLMATVMSTVDSNSFLAATTFGHDIMPRLVKNASKRISYFTKVGLVLSTALALLTALVFRSAIDLWHVIGSIGTPALLVPLFFSFVGKRRMPPGAAFLCMLSGASVAILWYLTRVGSDEGRFWLSIEPVFPGLLVTIVIYLFTAKAVAQSLPKR